MKKIILSLTLLAFYYNVFGQLDDAASTSNGSMTLGTGSGTLYQFSGDQRGTDGTNQSQGGFGLLSGANQISPIIWMYGFGGRNAFQVRKKGYNSTVQSGSTLFHVGVNGKVGIGTTSPSQKLHINSGFNGLLVNGSMGGNNFTDHQVEFTFTDAGVSESGVKFNKKDGGANFDLMNAYYNGSEVFVIRNSGKVGIGTTNPSSKLEVKDVVSLYSGNNIGSLTLGQGTSTLYEIAGAQRGTDVTNQGQGGFGLLSGANQISPIIWMYGFGGRNAFQVRKKGFNSTVQNGSTLFHVGVDGKVGIGTTTPKNKLSVNGTIWAKEVLVSLTDAADWVFEDDYKLRSLSEVEEFVRCNKHLPDVPSADEFRKKDLNVAEMDNKLLQKIEELTLYLIEQNKKIKELQKEVQILKKSK